MLGYIPIKVYLNSRKLLQKQVAMEIKNEILKKIGEKIIEYRKRNEQTQADIGFFTEIEISEISRYEQGKINLTISTLLKFSKALNVHPKELLDFNLPEGWERKDNKYPSS